MELLSEKWKMKNEILWPFAKLIILITNNFEEFYTKAFGIPSKFIDTIAQKKPPLYRNTAGVSYWFKSI